jgi:hypothetical protein
MVGANNMRSMPVVQLDSETTSQLLIQVEPTNQVHIHNNPSSAPQHQNPSIVFIIFAAKYR